MRKLMFAAAAAVALGTCAPTADARGCRLFGHRGGKCGQASAACSAPAAVARPTFTPVRTVAAAVMPQCAGGKCPLPSR